VDGTSATSHAVGAAIEHTLSAQEIDDLNAAVFTTPSTPVALTPDIAGAVGAATTLARSDHVHNVPAATAVTSGLANAEGVSGSFARADHTHDQAALSVGTAELVDLSVTAAKIANDTITATQIAPDAIGTSELGPLAATSAEIAANAIIAGKIAAGGVSATNQIADAIVTLAKFASEAVSTWTITFANVTLGTGGTTWRGYFKLGRLVVGWCGFNLGTSGANVTGDLSFNLPVTPQDLTGGAFAGANVGGLVLMRASQAGVNSFASLGRIDSTGTAQAFVTTGTNTNYGATAPFNWDNNDHAECMFAYVATS